MRTSLRKIGNSRGIIIPAALLASAEIGEEVELRQEAGRLVVEAVKAPRAGVVRSRTGDSGGAPW